MPRVLARPPAIYCARTVQSGGADVYLDAMGAIGEIIGAAAVIATPAIGRSD